MALTMLDKTTDRTDKSEWPSAIAAEFAAERQNNKGCVGTALVSESDRSRVWIIRLAPGERVDFHRHVLDCFWTCITGGRGSQHVRDRATSNTAISRARPGTRAMGPASSRSMTSPISAPRKWSS